MSGGKFEELGVRVGRLVEKKNAAYGNAFDECGEFLKILFPNGIQPNQYGDALSLVRIFDKMKRIATDKDALGESPYQDIAGYGLLGLNRDEEDKAKNNVPTTKQTLGKGLVTKPVAYPVPTVLGGGSIDIPPSNDFTVSVNVNASDVEHAFVQALKGKQTDFKPKRKKHL